MADGVALNIERELVDAARKELGFSEDVPASAVVRKALYKAAGRDNVETRRKTGRPRKQRSDAA